MSKLSIFIPVLVAVGLTMADCNKARQKDFFEMDSDSAVITHFNFQPGTYWIYQDALSGRMDSFYVRDNQYITQTETNTTYRYHYITIVELNVDGTAPADSANWVLNYQGTRIMADYDYLVGPYGWTHQIMYRPLYAYPFLYGDLKSTTDTAALIKVDSIYTINGMSFPRAAHIYHYSDRDSPPTITVLNDSLVVNDDVGMIRISLSHPLHSVLHDWQLVRYHIVK